MSAPRRVLPGQIYLITRRTILRRLLLRPDPQMNQILAYLLAVTAHRYGLRVHAFCAMSNHIHLVATDVRGEISSFLHAFHRMVAVCTKDLRGWNDVVWDKSPTSTVTLETEAAVIEKIAYVIANPVTAGLVEHAHEWPGVKVLVEDIGRGELRAPRPELALKREAWPSAAALPISLPPGIEPSGREAFLRKVASQVEYLEAQAHAQMQAHARPSLGAERVCAVPPESRATTAEPALDRKPTFAVGRGQEDAARRAAGAVRTFRTAYRAALDLWRAGMRDVVFPAGTWLMRVLHNAVVSAPTISADATIVV
jgi:REP element-mobilizing transposase RayT